MKTRGKVLLLIVSALALVIATIFGTLAYLTDKDAVTNTFTVGNIGITLNEADVNDAGEPLKDNETTITDASGNTVKVTREEADRVQGNVYHLVPGHVYVKDPTVTVDAKSEEAYIRMIVKVKNIKALKDALPTYVVKDNDGNEVFLLQNLLDGTWNEAAWPYYGYKEDSNTGIGIYEFRYHKTVGDWHSTADELELEPLFTKIKVPGEEITNNNIKGLADVVIDVEAHAMQADGFKPTIADDATDEQKAAAIKAATDAAWAAFDGQYAKSGN